MLKRCQILQDEALFAVQVSTTESQRSSDVIRNDFDRQRAELEAKHRKECESLASL